MNVRKIKGPLLVLTLVLAWSGIGLAQQSDGAQAGRAQKARSYLFVSPNTRENLTLAEVLRALNSREEKRLIAAELRIACRLGLRARVSKTIGSWTDGVEHSTMLRVEADEETVRYADAWLGKEARQKSVLYFRERPAGTARMYVLSSTGRRRSLSSIVRTLNRKGISNRTLVPGAHQTLVYVVDFNDELRQRITEAARQLGARHRVLRGMGDFIGDDSDRDKAAQIFSDIIAKFEREHPPVRSDCGVGPTRPRSLKVISIAGARRLPPGTVVAIEGSVTVPSGTFKASISDEGFAVQDGSGGIYVTVGVNLSLGVGERVRVEGKLTESNGQLSLVPVDTKDVKRRGRGSKVKPLTVKTGKVGEETEGRLLKVTGTIARAVVSDLPYGFRLFIDDGSGEIQVFVSASAKIELDGLEPGRRVSVTGFSGQYKDRYEIEPRFAADIERHF